jgi:PKD repeat protein
MGRRAADVRSTAAGEGGFTILEVVIAMSIVAGAFTALAHATFGGMAALQASRSRSVFIELTNAEVEDLRALRYDAVGVSTTDPDLGTAYPGNLYKNRQAVLIDVAAEQAADPTFPDPPPAVEQRTTAPVEGVRTPYTVRRWITWSKAAGNAGSFFIKNVTVRFEWADQGGQQRSAQKSTLVYPGGLGKAPVDAPPIARVTTDVISGTVPVTVTFDGTTSSDSEGPISTFGWQFGDGATATGSTTTHTYTVTGTYTAVLTVTDSSGQTHARAVDITAVDPGAGDPPVAIFSAAPTTGVAPLSVTFDASDSYDPEGGTLTYRWEWGDGTDPGTGVGANHQYSSAGSFLARLVVTDPTGLTAAANIVIETTPLSCQITAASFANPADNPVPNDIAVTSSNRPRSTTFVFHATTNTACTSVTAQLPKESGSLLANLTYSDSGGVRTWIGSVTTSEKFNRANDQTGFFTGSDSASFPISFDVHT